MLRRRCEQDRILMAGKRTKEKKGARRVRIELGTGGLLLWSGGLLFLLVWIFALGIMVGRGSLPGDRRAATEAGRNPLPPLEMEMEQPKLAFYDKLAAKKDQARQREEIPAAGQESRGGSASAEETPGLRQKSQSVGSDLYRPPGGGKSGFTVQVAALETRGTAEELSRELRRKGHPAYFYDVSIQGKTYFRVRCGRFGTRDEAEAYARRLRTKEGIEGFVSEFD
jgi:hypothetical protein